MVEVGQTVRDVITGYEGIVTARTEYLHGCVRVSVQSRELLEGKPVEYQSFDEPQLEVLDKPNILDLAPLTNRPGGERPIVSRAPVPSRY